MKRRFPVLILAVAACQASRDYTVDVVAEHVPQLRVIRVRATETSTKVTFRYDAGQETRRIGIHPAGHVGAFVLTDATSNETYALVSVQGIAELPERTTVRPEGTAQFVLTFPAISRSTTLVHLSEGPYDPETGENTWQFRDIKLR